MNEVYQNKRFVLYSEENINDEGANENKFYRKDLEDEDKNNLIHIYSIICTDLECYCEYYFEGDSINKVIIELFIEEGYDVELPKFISDLGFGFTNPNVNRFFKYKFPIYDIDTLVISIETESNKIDNQLMINYADLDVLLGNLNQEKRAHSDTNKILLKNFLVEICPDVSFEYAETNNNKDLIFRNLNDKMISNLTAEEVERLGDFYVKAIAKFKRKDIVDKLNTGLLKNAQLITLKDIIRQYEKHLTNDPLESVWQGFFDKYITLFDSRYVNKIDFKNIATGITKYPDLVLMDIYGYLDFYELKRCDTKLLSEDKSHKTFYLSTEVSKVIAQVSDYLQKVRDNAVTYAKTIEEESENDTISGLDVKIINPRAIIVIGHSKELNTQKKRNSFKSLREGFKDIEFVLYDELLERLKNLLKIIEEDKN
ncbi:Shedu immune nuclease family protein [Myroides sp. DW712]|uniref:Shedu immune nuclease family protein n=1 Tax=Myroides sp. DW712 TaxID=3389800 RepID=UPI00397AB69B